MPGPPVVVCKGDKLVVDVKNHLAAEVTSFHFHGNEANAKSELSFLPLHFFT